MAIEPEVDPLPHDEDEGGPVKSFLEHLEDLRWVLIKSIATLAVAVLICLLGGNYVVGILKRPLEKAQARYRSDEKIVVVLYGTNRIGTYSLDLDQWDAVVAPPNRTNSWLLETNEIVGLKSLATQLSKPNKADAPEVAKFVADRLSPTTRTHLTNFNEVLKSQSIFYPFFPTAAEKERTATASAQLAQSLTVDLNRIIESGPIYDQKRFDGVKLSPATQKALTNNLAGKDLLKLNRRLLLHAFPMEITSYGEQVVVVQLEPKSDGNSLVLGLQLDKSPEAAETAKRMHVDLVNISPAGAFFVAFQVAIYAGIAVSSPILFYFLAQFIFPALKWKEKKYIYRGMLFFVPLFFIGASFCYFLLLPVALAASQLYSGWLGFSATFWQAEEYISFVSKFILGMGLGFEMPVVILVLVKIGILNYSMLSKGRRYMIIINLVLGALLTTPEVLTQVLMAVPLQLLYEISIWIAWYWERQEKKRLAAQEAAERNQR